MHWFVFSRNGQGYRVIRYSIGLSVGMGTALVVNASPRGVRSSASAMVFHSCSVIMSMCPVQHLPHL